MTDPKKPSPQQTRPVVPPKQIVWMKCRASEACPGNQAYISLLTRNPLVAGGGTSYRYRCTTCNGAWQVTR